MKTVTKPPESCSFSLMQLLKHHMAFDFGLKTDRAPDMFVETGIEMLPER